MKNKKRLIDANALIDRFDDERFLNHDFAEDLVNEASTVDAVEVEDEKLLQAVRMLIEQYEHSKRSDFVHNPIAHAFYHTWKHLDERRFGERGYSKCSM